MIGGCCRAVIRVLQRVWDHPLGGIAYILTGFCFVLLIGMIASGYNPVAKQVREEQRLEQLLWDQSGVGRRISRALAQLELMEATGAVEPKQAVAMRKKLEQGREKLRRNLRDAARRILEQKRARDVRESEH